MKPTEAYNLHKTVHFFKEEDTTKTYISSLIKHTSYEISLRQVLFLIRFRDVYTARRDNYTTCEQPLYTFSDVLREFPDLDIPYWLAERAIDHVAKTRSTIA